MTSANIYISPKVVAERFERYFKIKVSSVECIVTHNNHHFIVYFNEPLPTNYMETLASSKCEFLQTQEGLLYIRPVKPTNLDEYITKYHCNVATGEMYCKAIETTSVYKHNGERYEPTTENPFL